MPTFSRLCIHATRVIIMWAIHYRPPKLKSIPITRSAEKPSSTMANLPARHRPNTHPAPSNCFQPSPNTSSRYHVHFSASDATSDRAIKVDTKRMKITPPRAISTTVLVSFEGRQSTPPSPMKNGVNMKNWCGGVRFSPTFCTPTLCVLLNAATVLCGF